MLLRHSLLHVVHRYDDTDSLCVCALCIISCTRCCYHCIGKGFGSCFDYVESRTKVCSPNTAFACHLLELAELPAKDNVVVDYVMFRCAHNLK